jgi:hypothetical protein
MMRALSLLATMFTIWSRSSDAAFIGFCKSRYRRNPNLVKERIPISENSIFLAFSRAALQIISPIDVGGQRPAESCTTLAA